MKKILQLQWQCRSFHFHLPGTDWGKSFCWSLRKLPRRMMKQFFLWPFIVGHAWVYKIEKVAKNSPGQGACFLEKIMWGSNIICQTPPYPHPPPPPGPAPRKLLSGHSLSSSGLTNWQMFDMRFVCLFICWYSVRKMTVRQKLQKNFKQNKLDN